MTKGNFFQKSSAAEAPELYVGKREFTLNITDLFQAKNKSEADGYENSYGQKEVNL